MENAAPDYQKFAQMWLEFVTKMASAGAAAGVDSMPSDVAKQMRETYFQALGQYTEEYMRSPQFLEMMKQSTDNAVAFRQQANEFFTQAHHAVGSLARSDVDGLLMAVRRSETRILDKLDELATRLNDLETRLGALESSDGKPRKSK